MNQILGSVLFALYMIPAMVLMAYALNLYVLLLLWARRKKQLRNEAGAVYEEFRNRHSDNELPPVVTQLPVYNEYNVMERVMRAAAAMKYPAGRHTIQVLDDSTDASRELIDRVAADLNREGHDVRVIRRASREGFKAGALKYGMTQTDAQFFAIFDADFVPPPDFLLRTMPFMLLRRELGVVQARWGHLNADHSLITQAEALGLDGHFTIDQAARAGNGLFMNFNGTAGLWRRQAIADGGGWQHDTLTEDLDLSYRSQIAGWKFFYLFDLVVPAELPANINAFKSQQFRWAKGSVQTAIKLLPAVFRSNASWLAKTQAFFHMTSYMVHPLMIWLAVWAVPFSLFASGPKAEWLGIALSVVFVLGTLAPYLMYGVPQCVLHPKGWKKLVFLPAVTIFGVGIAISTSRAVWEAVIGKRSDFVRTPKAGDKTPQAYSVGVSRVTLFEMLVGLYCIGAVVYYLVMDKYTAIAYMLICAVGFSAVGMMSVFHALSDGSLIRRKAAGAA